jgi:hypothetical protein
MRSWVWALGLIAAAAAGAAAARDGAAAKHPDFNGLWSNASLTGLEREDDFKTLSATEAEAAAYEKKHRGKPPEAPPGEDDVGGVQSEWWETDVGLARIRGQIRTSWIVAPADGKQPFTEAAKTAMKARRAKRKVDFDNPEGRSTDEQCLNTDAAGPPLQNGGYNDNYQFVQTREQLAIWTEYMHDVRVVRIGGAGHPAASLRFRMGDSIGRWDGDTLVIETTNFTPAEVDPIHPDTTADMRVVERLSKLPSGEIFYAFQVTDPARYTQTWMGEMVMHLTKGPIYEFACHEGNYGLRNILAGARHEEAVKAAGGTTGK